MKQSSSRPLYDPQALRPLFEPRSVAIVGVSTRAGSFGQRAWGNMASFHGRLYAVNPRYERYFDQPCYPDLAALPEVPDCVVVATPREGSEEVLRQCAALGIPAAVMFASGYAETGLPEHISQQERIVTLAREGAIRILGPNCMGYVNTALGAGLTFGLQLPLAQPVAHGIGLVSQSGAIAFALVEAIGRGKAFSHVLTAGNAVDVDVADQVAYLAAAPACKAIACVLEGIGDPYRLVEAGRRARLAGKPVVVFKIARSQEGAAAAVAHTGALAGSDAACVAAFRRAGMVLVDDLEDLLETATFFAKAAALPLAGPGVAVLSVSGGMAIMAADKAAQFRVPLPQPSEPVRQLLEKSIPQFGSARNPCDVTAQVANEMATLVACGEAMLSDAAYGAMVYPHPCSHEVATERLRQLDRAAARQGKINCAVWLSEWLEGPGADEAERMTHTAVFRSMRSCFAALAARSWWESLQDSAHDVAPPPPPYGAGAAAREIVALARGEVLTEGEGLRLLAAYGIPVVTHRLARTAEEAVEMASQAGYPVVMKIHSPDVPHKTDAGGVRLGVADAPAARAAYASILESVRRAAPGARIDGVAVQPMLTGGVELVLGARHDPVFGPLVLAGLGGIFVEVIHDVSVRMAPVNAHEARAMLLDLRGAKILQGFRGCAPVDLDRLSEVVARFSVAAADLDESVAEIDVNPLICNGDCIAAVDSLVRRRHT